MLSNTLTVEDEEAVQAELRELQREAVRISSQVTNSRFHVPTFQLGEVAQESVDLPSVPTTEPVDRPTSQT